MSGIELNKLLASILIASLVAMIVGVISNILYKPKLDLSERGYEIALTEEVGNNSDEQGLAQVLDIPALMAKANADNGAQIIKKCQVCHTLGQGQPHKVGPNLWNIIDAAKGKKEGYAYSKALSTLGGIWDNESLFSYIANPSKYLPGTKMSFAGLKKPEDVADLILYLKTIHQND